MVYVLLILLGILAIVLLLILILAMVKENNTEKKDVFVDGGYNVETGLKENLSGKIFVGTENNSGETYLMYDTDNRTKVKTVYIYNLTRGESRQFVNEPEIYVGRDVNRNNLRNYMHISGDNTVSKLHCKISVTASTVYIEDMNSSNHTYVNGNIILSKVIINKGDIVKVGKTKLKIET